MNRPLLLDLFCGAGGASMGYHRAGFDIVGVDINPQPNYPFDFLQDDAVTVLQTLDRGEFTAIHASPPCQHYSAMSECRPGLSEDYPDLVGPVRELLVALGVPWVMENVNGSTLLSQPSLYGDLNGITLCGRMFGLKLYRHRLFESNVPLAEPPHPRHLQPSSRAGHWEPGTVISVAGDGGPGAAEAREAMGIDWMTRSELSESIPPAYTEYIGTRLLQSLDVAA